MHSYFSLAEVPDDFGPSAVTIGKFDGVHAGHRAVIDRVLAAARERGIRSVLVTFDRNPLSLLQPDRCPEPLLSNAQKLEHLAPTGLDATLMLTFDRALSELGAEDFVTSVLVVALRARVVLVGADFRFGAKGAGTVALLTELGRVHGFEVLVIDDVTPDGERRVSSTWIRELLADGRVDAAARLLGALPTVRAVVVRGAQRGHALGFPTANLAPQLEGHIPADGIYAAWLTVDGSRFAAAVSVGNNPTFEGVRAKQVEAHLIDATLDLYGRTVEVSFVAQLRGMQKFPDTDSLVAQMAVDVRQAREILTGHE